MPRALRRDDREFLDASRQGSRMQIALEKFFLAAIGSIPWVGGFLSAAASLPSEFDAAQLDAIQVRWLQEHERKLEDLRQAADALADRLISFGEEVEDRIQSDDYLSLVRRAFRAWDKADTDEKRRYLCNLIGNAAGSRVCSDDVVRLFVDWLDSLHESHLEIIKLVYQRRQATRYDIWVSVWGAVPPDTSAEADLFRMLIRDLSTGDVIRQHRDVTAEGQFLKKARGPIRRPASPTIMSSFEPTQLYELTQLGQQFVHYAMNESITRLGERTEPA